MGCLNLLDICLSIAEEGVGRGGVDHTTVLGNCCVILMGTNSMFLTLLRSNDYNLFCRHIHTNSSEAAPMITDHIQPIGNAN